MNNNLLNGCANITGGGIVDNLKRILPNNLNAEINLFKINPLKIFHWLKSHNISDKEMLKTFNCGVGFCLVINPKNLRKVIKFFPKKYKPYIIGKICNGTKQIKLHGKINWIKKKTAIFISGNGSNMKNLIKFSKIKNSPIVVDFVLSSNKKANGNSVFKKKKN